MAAREPAAAAEVPRNPMVTRPYPSPAAAAALLPGLLAHPSPHFSTPPWPIKSPEQPQQVRAAVDQGPRWVVRQQGMAPRPMSLRRKVSAPRRVRPRECHPRTLPSSIQEQEVAHQDILGVNILPTHNNNRWGRTDLREGQVILGLHLTPVIRQVDLPPRPEPLVHKELDSHPTTEVEDLPQAQRLPPKGLPPVPFLRPHQLCSNRLFPHRQLEPKLHPQILLLLPPLPWPQLKLRCPRDLQQLCLLHPHRHLLQ